MKGKLIKTEVNYLLEDDKGVVIASTSLKNVGNRLSKENCDEIFGVVNVEKLAEESWGDKISSPYHAYVDGFNKAMELNKDKVFTLEDMRTAYKEGYFGDHCFEVVIQSLQQPTEIEVEIETKPYTDVHEGFELEAKREPKLDRNGCLMLKNI